MRPASHDVLYAHAGFLTDISAPMASEMTVTPAGFRSGLIRMDFLIQE